MGAALAAADARIAVALSGGLDSTVLLHALQAQRAAGLPFGLRAIHVNHQLHPDSGTWATRAAGLCAELRVPVSVVAVVVDRESGDGPEAAARRARYAVFEREIGAGEQLLTAHHRDDQVETLLLRLLRGSGPDGLGAIPARAEFGAGELVRPLLELPRSVLEDYAVRHGLRWVTDPANEDVRLDRNYLRWRILPELRSRWRGADGALARSAGFQREAAEMLADLAARDLHRISRRGRIVVDRLAEVPEPRQRNVLRHLCLTVTRSVPGDARLRDGLAQLLTARPDRAPRLAWPGGEIRRYRDELWVLPAAVPTAPRNDAMGDVVLRLGETLDLGRDRGRLRLVRAMGQGMRPDLVGDGLRVAFRRGGERLRPAGRRHHQSLKRLLQDAGIAPWMRAQIPLLYAAGELAAVADLWLAAEVVAAPGEPGCVVRWDRHPPLTGGSG